MSEKFLQEIRQYELTKVLPRLVPGFRILEIGAGGGWQAKGLAELGYRIEAIDVETSRYAKDRVWSVREYDGKHIPFPDDDFDVVLSSNTLEHILYVEEFQHEIRRVLKPDGLAIHILPTASWRIWATISYYPLLVERTVTQIVNKYFSDVHQGDKKNQGTTNAKRSYRWRRKFYLTRNLIPRRHGEIGNFITEIYWFSRFRWIPLFSRTGWQITHCYPTRLFYAPFLRHHTFLSLKSMHCLSYVLGSSCLVYVMQKTLGVELYGVANNDVAN